MTYFFPLFHQKKQGGSLACRVCGKEIVAGGEIVRALESLFHPNCFKCSVCGKNLSDDDDEGGFNSDEQKNLYCRDDYHKWGAFLFTTDFF